ncbi:enterochelin esterase domain-containing protein, partial [Salmonella enterica]|uniref:enterochelin esterase domain-containing protein n=1 Tax=Salmonella enterica TaxID=28901 RepID=UPI001EED9B24
AWWRTKTGPECIREKDGNYRVTFWWRDPQGNETHSPIRRGRGHSNVDTHQQQKRHPNTTARTAGADVSRRRTALRRNPRGRRGR